MQLPVTDRAVSGGVLAAEAADCVRDAMPRFQLTPVSQRSSPDWRWSTPMSRAGWCGRKAGAWQPQQMGHSQTDCTFDGEGPWTLVSSRGRPLGTQAYRCTAELHCHQLPRWRFDDVMVSFATDRGGRRPALRSVRCVPVCREQPASGSGASDRTCDDCDAADRMRTASSLLPPFEPAEIVLAGGW